MCQATSRHGSAADALKAEMTRQPELSDAHECKCTQRKEYVMSEYDLVIRNGTVVDGEGGEPFRADVAISNGLIEKVGAVKGKGRQEIDAKGCFVTPGFVDVHTHYDGQITWENTLSPSSNHGVTTVIMGNCGVGFAPTRAAD